MNVQGPGGHGESEVHGDWGQKDNNVTLWPVGDGSRLVGSGGICVKIPRDRGLEQRSTGGKAPGSIRKQTELRNACASKAKAPFPPPNRRDVSVP